MAVVAMAVKLIWIFVLNIMMIEPKNRVSAETKLPTDWLSAWLMASTSLVTRDKVSP